LKLYDIDDEYMFRTGEKNGKHTYAVYYDRKAKRYKAIQTTHLYRKDNRRDAEIKAGALLKEQLPTFEGIPSCVRNYAYTTDVNGNKINLKSPHVKERTKRHLPKKTSNRIRQFASAVFRHKKKTPSSKTKR